MLLYVVFQSLFFGVFNVQSTRKALSIFGELNLLYLASSMDSKEVASAAWHGTMRSMKIRPKAKTIKDLSFNPILKSENRQHLTATISG